MRDPATDILDPDSFAAWLLRRCGIRDLSAYRATALHRRIPACLRALRVSSTGEARALLEQFPECLQTALNSVLIGVTEFFRDRAIFDALGRHVIPSLIGERGGVRVLAAGCSGGHEVYSLAMMVAEAGALERSRFVGVDCRADAIAAAHGGVFSDFQLASIDPVLRGKYFVAEGNVGHAAASLRAKMEWRLADLLTEDARGPWDIVLFRNVAIYMLPQAVRRMCAALVGSLSERGFLVTGKSERPAGPLPLVRVSNCIYQKISRP